MVESVFHFFKIHRKVVFGNTPVEISFILGWGEFLSPSPPFLPAPPPRARRF